MSFVPANTPLSAAHLVLGVPALVDAIVKSVAAWKMIALTSLPGSNEVIRPLLVGNARRDVLSLRSVGKVFWEATLNELWHTQTGLLELFKVIGVLEPKDRSDDDFWEAPARSLTRSLTMEDVDKLLPYSARIKTFYISLELPETRLKESDVQQVLKTGAVLFPNLRVMSGFCLDEDLTEISFVMQTMGNQALSQLVLHEFTTPFPAQLVEFARGKATNLKLLSLGNDRTSGCWEAPYSAILSVLRHATNLVALNLNVLADEETFSLVVRMPRLVRLCIRASFGDSFSFPTAPFTFPALLELELHMASLPAGSRLLQHSSFPRLKKLIFLFLRDGTNEAHPGDVRTFMETVVTAASANTLEALGIQCPVSRWREFPEQRCITDEDLLPLLRCSGMRSCSLRAGWYWDLDDAFLQKMALAWPKIRHLYLDPNNRWRGGTSGLTLTGLEALALHCPELVAFGAVIDCEQPMPTLPDVPKFAIPLDGKWHEALRTLAVGKSIIAEPTTVAVFLSARFPNLTTINTFFPATQDRDARRWAKVAEFIPALAVVRTQERKRARLISQDTTDTTA